MKGFHKFLSEVMHIAVVAIAVVALCGCNGFGSSSSSKYAPWTDLSMHYNLDKINVSGDACHFNSYELSQGLAPYTSKRLNNNEYFATVLGQKVLLRSEPKISPKTVNFIYYLASGYSLQRRYMGFSSSSILGNLPVGS